VTNFNYVASWTRRSTHVIKWGFDIRRERQEFAADPIFHPRGRLRLHPAPLPSTANSSNGFRQLLRGFPAGSAELVGRDLALFSRRAGTLFSSYFQTKWQVSKKLTGTWPSLGIWARHHAEYPGGLSNYILQ